MGQPYKQLISPIYFDKKSLREYATKFNIEETTARIKKHIWMGKLCATFLPSK